MSKLESLIAELCPDGVEYKPLEEVCNFKRGTAITKKDITEGNIPVIAGGQKPAYYCDKSNREGETIVVAGSGAYAGFVSYWQTPVFVSDAFTASPNDSIKPKYLYYFLKNNQEEIHASKCGGGIPHVYSKNIANLKIPLAPLEVQAEIVRILDCFTELIDLLNIELGKRKQQYEYYRDSLFSFGDDVEFKTLREISNNLDSKRKPVTKSNRESGSFPYYGASGIVDYVSSYIFDGDFLLVSEDGANLVARATPIAFSACGKIWVNNHAHILQFDNYASRRFVEFYLNSIDLSKFISVAAQPKLTKENLNKIQIPVPPIEEQERIVNILDRFDSLCNDLSSGIPAEIKARKKQYEYYRDKLLTFKEKQN